MFLGMLLSGIQARGMVEWWEGESMLRNVLCVVALGMEMQFVALKVVGRGSDAGHACPRTQWRDWAHDFHVCHLNDEHEYNP